MKYTVTERSISTGKSSIHIPKSAIVIGVSSKNGYLSLRILHLEGEESTIDLTINSIPVWSSVESLVSPVHLGSCEYMGMIYDVFQVFP